MKFQQGSETLDDAPNLSRYSIGNRRSAAAIGNMLHIDAREFLEQFARQMHRRGDTGTPVGESPGFVARVVYQALEIGDWEFRIDGDHKRRRRH